MTQTDEWSLQLSKVICAMQSSELNDEGICTHLEIQQISTDLFGIIRRIHAMAGNRHLEVTEGESCNPK